MAGGHYPLVAVALNKVGRVSEARTEQQALLRLKQEFPWMGTARELYDSLRQRVSRRHWPRRCLLLESLLSFCADPIGPANHYARPGCHRGFFLAQWAKGQGRRE